MASRKTGVMIFLGGFLSMLAMMCFLVAILSQDPQSAISKLLETRNDESYTYFSGSGMMPDENETTNTSFIVSHVPLPTPIPTPDIQNNPTCRVLERLANRATLCSTRSQCTELHCMLTSVGTMDMYLEPCSTPPAIHVVAADTSGNTLLNDTLTHSREEQLGNTGVTLNVVIEQSHDDDAITIKVDADIFGVASVPIIPETIIPLNRQQCGFIPHTHTRTHAYSSSYSQSQTQSQSQSQSQSPSLTSLFAKTQSHSTPSHSRGSSQSFTVKPTPSVDTTGPTKHPPRATSSVAVAVAVPVSLLLALLVAIVIVVAIVISVRRHRRAHMEYNFQRMAFSEDKDDDEDL